MLISPVHETISRNIADIRFPQDATCGGIGSSPPNQAVTESNGLHLHLFNDTSNPENVSETSLIVNVVFVHGLGGHLERTWKHRSGTV